MSVAEAARLAGTTVLTVWGIGNLLAALRGREAPLLRRARVLAGASGLLLVGALLIAGAGHGGLALLTGIAGLGCGALWLYILFKQSLHNTTM